jgi:hypothetical protein
MDGVQVSALVAGVAPGGCESSPSWPESNWLDAGALANG